MNIESILRWSSTWPNNYFKTTGLLAIFLLTCLYFAMRASEGKRRLFIVVTLLTGLFVFSPIALIVVTRLGYYSVFYRMYWLLPIVPVVACFMANLICREQSRSKRVVSVLFVIFLFLSIDQKILDNFKVDYCGNIYGIPNDTYQSANIIRDYTDDEKVVVAATGSISQTMRLYDQNIYLAITEQMDWGINNNKVSLSSEERIVYIKKANEQADLARLTYGGILVQADYMVAAIQTLEVDFLVVPKTSNAREYLEQMQIQYCGDTDNFEVYYCGGIK